METNPYQVKMDPQAHKQLKKLANQLGITIGEMIQNLLASFKFRLKRIAEKHGAMIDSELHTEIIRLLLKMDAGKLTEEEVNEALKDIKIVSPLQAKWTETLEASEKAIMVDGMNIEIQEAISNIARKHIKKEEEKEVIRLNE